MNAQVFTLVDHYPVPLTTWNSDKIKGLVLRKLQCEISDLWLEKAPSR